MRTSAVKIVGVPSLRIIPNGDRWLHTETHGDADLPLEPRSPWLQWLSVWYRTAREEK